MAAHTPQNGHINRLLQGINNGFSLFSLGRDNSGARGENVAAETATEIHDEIVREPNVVTVANVVDAGDNNTSFDNVNLPPATPQDHNPTPKPVTMDTRKKSAKEKNKSTKNGKTKKAKEKPQPKDNNCHPSVDPPRTKASNPLEMEAAFDEGYDSDGWVGPPRGTDPNEEDAVDEKELPEITNDAPRPAPAPTTTTQTGHIPIPEDVLNKMTILMLKHELRIRNVSLPKAKKKADLLAKLREALDKECPVLAAKDLPEKGPDDLADFAIGSAWRQLEADIDVDEPINPFPLARAPTVSAEEAAVQPKPKQNFSQLFDRPVFKGDNKGKPRSAFLEQYHLTQDSTPVEFVDAFFPMYENKVKDGNGDPFLSMEYLARNTNLRATLAFAGEATYDDWHGNFSIKEIRQHLGLYVLNGLSPSPGLEKKFDYTDKANYNSFVSQNFGTNAVRRLRQFKCFFSCQDPLKAVPDRKASPLFKILSVVKWIRKIGPMSWECGIDLSLDEQTMGFQGHHADKLRITYKKEGDGFQCDALCDDGFTYTVYFRNEPSPNKYTRQGYSPLHARCLWIFDQLTQKHHRVWVDNLYMSARFAKGCYVHDKSVLVAGVSRIKDRGIPKCVLQEPVKKQQLATTRGTMKAAVLEGDSNCPELVAVSIYDNKPVHFLTMSCDSIAWVEKKRNVWNPIARKMDEVKYLRVNINNDYNYKMNNVDIADQLRNNYKMDRWLRQKKWWWSIYLWGQGVLLTNAYLVYCRTVPKNLRLTHYQFLLSVATAWIDKNETDIRHVRRIREKKCPKRSPDGATTTPQQQRPRPEPLHNTRTTSTSTESSTPLTSPMKAPMVNKNALDPTSGVLKQRLDHFGKFHCPIPSESKKPSCALHRFLLGRDAGTCSQTRGKIVTCEECHVNLCIPCFRTFHTVKDIVGEKENLARQLE